MKNRRRRAALLVCLFLALTAGTGVVAMLLVDWHIARLARGRIFSRAEDVPPRDVALVLGARVFGDGRLSAMLEDRVRSAVDLYKAGKVKKLLMTGDNSQTHYDEVTAMRKFAIKLGVNSDDVVRDFAGFRTYDSVYRARELWGIRSTVVVSQSFHLPRALYIAAGLGVDAVGFSSDLRRYQGGSMTRSLVREVFARTAAWLDVNVLHTKPHFLGPKEDLSGDKQAENVPNQ